MQLDSFMIAAMANRLPEQVTSNPLSSNAFIDHQVVDKAHLSAVCDVRPHEDIHESDNVAAVISDPSRIGSVIKQKRPDCSSSAAITMHELLKDRVKPIEICFQCGPNAHALFLLRSPRLT